MGNQQQNQFQQRPNTAGPLYQYNNASMAVVTTNQNIKKNNSRSKSRQNNRTVQTFTTNTYKHNQTTPFINNGIIQNIRNNKIPQSPHKRPNIFSNNIGSPQFVHRIHQSPNSNRPPSNNRPPINVIQQQPQIPRPHSQNKPPQVVKQKQTQIIPSPQKKSAKYIQQKRSKLQAMLSQGNTDLPEGITYFIKIRLNQE